ncbi:efflux RND transporter periplasmic adaptor subunit [Tardiphaga robiniae]|uniref:Efflux RND transporter periplasmic adaptor subunit n=1 Tax=Tardiphaga robiniae TaxID=943830 RepID=A0A7G6U8R5_9BRAD|nr:efflux RND transporter periplasmic adaptor subunit [Tardiphaga robiniae]
MVLKHSISLSRSYDVGNVFASCLSVAAPVVALLLLAGCGKKEEAAAPPPPPVTVANPTKKVTTDWDEFTGRFDAIEQVQIRARVTGFVTKVAFTDGAVVKAGDLLYEIDPRQYQAAAEQAQGQLDDAKAKVVLAEKELERATTLIKTQAISENIVDQRSQAIAAAQAATLQAEGALKQAQLNVEYTKVVAPIAGRVSRHLVTVGNLVQGSESGATLLTSIVSLSPIYVYFDTDEATYVRNSKLWFEGKRPSSRDTPNPVQITLVGETKPSHEGKMDFLDNRLDVGTGTLRGRAIVDNKDLSILPGQFARVRVIASGEYEALLIPDAAVANDQSRKIVMVVKADDTVEARPVTLGPLDGGLRVIREGLKPDDRVIVDGIQRARVGAKVAPKMAAATPAPAAGTKP